MHARNNEKAEDPNKPIRIIDIIEEQIEEQEHENLRKVLGYVIQIVEGKKVPMIHGKYFYDPEIHLMPYPENINAVCDQIIAKIKEFKK